METSKEELHFFYDAQRRPVFVEYEGDMYRYIHNLQGDIVAIVDSTGNPVIEYTYDAWGKFHTTVSQLGISNTNPFAYRSYVFDEEVGLYYLQNRYYNPERGRFDIPDVIIDTKQNVLGSNAFAYCGNCPIRREDAEGTLWNKIFSFINKVGDVIEDAIDAVKECVADTFGIAYYRETSQDVSADGIAGIGYEVGTLQTTLIAGDDEKPIVLYKKKTTEDSTSYGISIDVLGKSVCCEVGDGQLSASYGYKGVAIDASVGINEVSLGVSHSKSSGRITTTTYGKLTVKTTTVIVIIAIAVSGGYIYMAVPATIAIPVGA